MRWYDWLMFGGPPVALLPVAIWAQTTNLPTGAYVAMWACWTGFTVILLRLLWLKAKK